MKKLIIIVILLLAAYGIFKGIQYGMLMRDQSKVPPVNLVVDNFKKQGLTVGEQQMSAEEKKVVENFQKDLGATQKQFGIDPNLNKALPVDNQIMNVDGIDLSVESYYSNDYATQAYNKQVMYQQRNRADAESRDYQYNETDYFLNGPFVMSIDHFRETLVNGKLSMKPGLLNLDQKEIDKIVQAFKSSPTKL